MTDTQQTYRVTWTIEVDAPSPQAIDRWTCPLTLQASFRPRRRDCTPHRPRNPNVFQTYITSLCAGDSCARV